MKKINPAYVQALKKIVKHSPYPSHMMMEIEQIEMDQAQIILDLARCHLQPFGIVHGGVLATLIDTATFWAAFLRLPEDSGLVNIDLKLNYLQPALDGRLTAKGVCMRPGRSISYSEAKVFDQKQNLVAHGTSSLMALEGKGLDISEAKFL
jgi:uncharacterized protein (TIGR00369 family)